MTPRRTPPQPRRRADPRKSTPASASRLPALARRAISAGIYDHTGWAVVVCFDGSEIVDKRRIELIDAGLPAMPFHHPCQHLPLDEAVELVARVRDSAESCARAAFDALPAGLRTIAIRERPVLPPSVADRIRSYYAQTRADGVMYRDALAQAAAERGWNCVEYAAKTVVADAAATIGTPAEFKAWLKRTGQILGRPWTRDHRIAAAAAIVALGV